MKWRIVIEIEGEQPSLELVQEAKEYGEAQVIAILGEYANFVNTKVFPEGITQDEYDCTCAYCINVVEVEEWDSDRVLEWECGLTGKTVDPSDSCKSFKHFNE